jgi:hypothetical protein
VRENAAKIVTFAANFPTLSPASIARGSDGTHVAI